MTTFRTGQALHIGQVRQVNQDHLLARDGLYVVADGMGGHRGGEVASEVAAHAVVERLDGSSAQALRDAVQAANVEVVTRASDDPDLRGMGTTVVALAAVTGPLGDHLTIVNVGDSRAYLLPAGSRELRQVSEDHSLVQTLVRQGQLTPADAAVHPQRNILTRALGIDERVLVDSFDLLPVAGDRYLLCSDGLFNEVSEERMASVLREVADPQQAAEQLVELANDNGGRDNISVLIVDVVDAGPTGELRPIDGDDRLLGVTYGNDEVGRSRPTPTERDDRPPESEPTPSAPAAARPAADDHEPAPAGGGDEPIDPTAPRTRITWRVFAFFGAVALIGVGTWFAIARYATSSYFVAFDGDEVVIWQGHPGGTLWYDPTLEERTGISRAEVRPENVSSIEGNRSFGSADDAAAYVSNVTLPPTTTTTTTTSTSTSSTTSVQPDAAAISGPSAPAVDDGLASTSVPAP